jgi:hypothetical protein
VTFLHDLHPVQLHLHSTATRASVAVASVNLLVRERFMSIRRFTTAAVLALAFTGGACAPAVRANPSAGAPAAGNAWVTDRMYFGRDIPGGGAVSDTAWAAFLGEVVTPRFPAGLTSWRAEGQWRDVSGAVVREPSFIVELLHPFNAETDAAVEQIAEEYKRRFRQEAVMRVRSSADVEFHEEE